ncbi:MAG: bifunctional oligoribonuclease/PAP phosphatase NrnA [Candidatus Gastranaerophilales bacterium]|nr:bifunctional oligoribonuclease/PAP phosphatase NrnA [Candidatus Gastranaerophilales bacterium]
MKMNSSETEIINIIKNAQNILVAPHVNPDGDCIGSAIAMKLLLKKEFGKEAVLFIQSKVPEVYKFLAETDSFKTAEELQNQTFDLVIAVDCAAYDRLTTAIPFFEKAEKTIVFDHHKTNPAYAKFNYILPDLSSTGEVLFNFMQKTGLSFDKDIADALYVAILTDTGGFKFDNTTTNTFLAVAELLKYGINPSELYKKCYESKPVEMVKLSALAVNNAKFLYDNKVVYTIITLDDMKKTKALNEHTDGIVELLRQINTVDLAFLIKETEDGCAKVSFRSKTFDVTKIASKFDGGGHTKAAGCTIRKNYTVALNKILEAIKEEADFAQ